MRADGTSAPPVEPTVCIANATKAFSGQLVLRDVSLDLIAGRVHALIGENGSGKSTLIKILSGYHAPTSGEVRVVGESLRLGQPAASHRAGLRFVHQHLGLVSELNAVDNLGLGAGFRNPGWIRWKAEAAEARRQLAALDIDLDVEKPLAEARAVERTAVAIARALRRADGNELRLLVLDEPTAALPPHEVAVLFNIIRQSCKRGIAVLYVSHRLDEIEEIADEVAVLRNGDLVGQVTRRDNFDRSMLAAMMLGRADDGGGGRGRAGFREDERAVPATRAPAAVRQDALEVRDLRTTTLHDVGFTAGRGEILGFAGIDGSGREQLARALVGAEPVTGQVFVNGTPVPRLSPAAAVKAGIALVPSVTEPGSAIGPFTVKENLTLARLPHIASRWGVRDGREMAVVAEWIARLDIRPPDPAKQMSLLSGGNRQKVVIAKWLALDNPVFVLSEPTAGVDVGARATIHAFLQREAARGVAFIICSTDIEELEAVCERVLVLREGRITAELRGPEVTREAIARAMAGVGESLGKVGV